MRIEPEIDGMSIVLLGKFNPIIIQPQWLGRFDLISTEQADDAEIGIIHPEVTQFAVGDRYRFTVDRERLNVETLVPPYVHLADLLSRIFGELLPHTPVHRMGINRSVHFSVGSEETRNKIGKLLAPHEPWGDWGELLDREPPDRGGVRSILMEQRGLNDRPDGFLRVKVEPSLKTKADVGIYVQVNDDFALADDASPEDPEVILRLLNDNFDASRNRGDAIIDHIMSLKDKV